ncbi:hypothetical protein LDENG_00100160 [Lucifuga dentata]|nr:hypothetical protein LDENG_00100160 [Lucifuga dentata]
MQSFLERSTIQSDTMNKLLVLTVLVALLAVSAESFRMPRQTLEEEEERGTLTKITDAFRSYYETAVDKAIGSLESINSLKLEEKAKNVYDETTKAVSTYFGIVQDQIYHIFYPSSK